MSVTINYGEKSNSQTPIFQASFTNVTSLFLSLTTHKINKVRGVSITDTEGNLMIADVNISDLSNITAVFNQPTSGTITIF